MFEVMQRMSDDPVAVCATCGAPVERVFHPPASTSRASGSTTPTTARASAREQREKAPRREEAGRERAPPSRTSGSVGLGLAVRATRARPVLGQDRARSPPATRSSKSGERHQDLGLSRRPRRPRAPQPPISLLTACVDRARRSRSAPSPRRAASARRSASARVTGAEPPISERREQAEQREAAHVGAQDLGRVPGGPRQVEERPDGQQLALDGVEDLLLALDAREVDLGRVAACCGACGPASARGCRSGGGSPARGTARSRRSSSRR